MVSKIKIIKITRRIGFYKVHISFLKNNLKYY